MPGKSPSFILPPSGSRAGQGGGRDTPAQEWRPYKKRPRLPDRPPMYTPPSRKQRHQRTPAERRTFGRDSEGRKKLRIYPGNDGMPRVDLIEKDDAGTLGAIIAGILILIVGSYLV